MPPLQNLPQGYRMILKGHIYPRMVRAGVGLLVLHLPNLHKGGALIIPQLEMLGKLWGLISLHHKVIPLNEELLLMTEILQDLYASEMINMRLGHNPVLFGLAYPHSFV